MVSGLLSLTDPGQASEGEVDRYLSQIKPVLKERCFACHGALKQKGRLRLDTVAAMRDRDILGENGELLFRILSHDPDERMPPEGDPLQDQEKAAIKSWLASGAPGPPDEQPEADPKSHWAFQRLERPPGFDPDAENPIDVYFLARHQAGKLVPQPAPGRSILIRRLYLDLIGLPPTPGQLSSSEPITTIIDDLLASPRYGERWGRHWMDVWRYSDWYGLGTEVRDSQKYLWRWRDWIVNSLNANKGYDQMIREMLAGDEIAPRDPQALAATGFLARSYFKFNRTTWLDNTIEHTSKAFMGLTMNCAKCHDHKYDPIDLPKEAWHPDSQSFVQEAVLQEARANVEAAEAHLEKMKAREASERKKKEAPPESKDPPLLRVAKTTSTFVDDFSKARPDLWEVVGDDWRYQGGLLSLTKASVDNPFLRSKAKHPEDFELDLKFRTTGGERWKSVGVRFDADESGNNSHWVYASAGGNKVHLARTIEGADQYTNGMVAQPIELNREYTLNLRVQDKLINVFLDGEFLFAHQLPGRHPGAIQLLAYDAIADFLRIEVKPLPADAMLREADENTQSMASQKVVTRELIELAEANLQAARANLAFKEAQIEADHFSERDAIETARRRLLEANLARAKVDRLDPKKAEQATKAIEKLEADLKAGNFPDHQPLSISKVSLIKTPNQDALPTPGSYPKSSTGRRTSLANWLTHRDHPLTARVAVNHIWLRHFGTPLVETVDDFGLRTPRPRHQDLLDFLALELIESGWDMKHLHRLMLSSKTWQRSSSNRNADPATLARDPDNREFWRMNGRRMESQVIRDSLLHLSGTLDLKPGGPPVTPSPEARRRSLYFFHSRDGRSKFLETFDDADVFACYRRSESIVPQQALAMMNSQTATMAAKQITEGFEKGLDQEAFVQAAFFKILARQASESELAESLAFLQEQPDREHFIHALLNLNDFLVIR